MSQNDTNCPNLAHFEHAVSHRDAIKDGKPYGLYGIFLITEPWILNKP